MKYSIVDILRVCYPSITVDQMEGALEFYQKYKRILEEGVNREVSEGKSINEAIIKIWDDTPVLEFIYDNESFREYKLKKLLSKNYMGRR